MTYLHRFLTVLLFILTALSASGQDTLNGFWYKSDTLLNSRMVFGVDSIFLLDSVELIRNDTLTYAEIEGITFRLNDDGTAQVCADYAQRLEKREDELVLLILEHGCSGQKYSSVRWQYHADEQSLTFLFHHLNTKVPASALHYKVRWDDPGRIVLFRKP